MINHYESMLNLTFEIEGLISLLQKRDDEGVKEVKALLDSKVKALYQATVAEASAEAIETPRPEVVTEAVPEVTESLPEIVEEPTEVAVTEFVEEPVAEFLPEPEVMTDDVTEVYSESENDVVAEPESVKTKLPVFTINDKFRFRRELFANSEADFVDTLNVLSAMSSFEEAEDYLYNDLCWDSSSDEVAEFMTVIKDYFDKR